MTTIATILLSVVLAQEPPVTPPQPAVDDAAKTPPAARLAITPWLLAGPFDVPPPALRSSKDSFASKLFETPPLDLARLDPQLGDPIGLLDETAQWQRADRLMRGSSPTPRILLGATRLDAARFVAGKLLVKSRHRFKIFLDGAMLGEKAKPDVGDVAEDVAVEIPLELLPGPHRLVVFTVFDKEGNEEWFVDVEFEPKDGHAASDVALSFAPTRAITIDDLLDTEAVSSLEVAPRGDLVAVAMRRPEVPAEFGKRWLEIRRTGDLALVFSTEALGDFQTFRWLPDGSGFGYLLRDGEKATLWLRDAAGAAPRAVLRDVPRLRDYRFLPDGKSVVYVADEEEKPDDRGVKRVRSLVDRWPWARTNARLHLASLDGSGLRRPLVEADESVALADLREDGAKLLFTRVRYDVAARPYQETDLFELDLGTCEARLLHTTPTLTAALYARGGDHVLLLGGPSLLAARRAAAPIPNDYDTRPYRLDPATLEVREALPTFAPAIDEAAALPDGRWLLRVEDGIATGIVTAEIATGAVEKVALPFPVASGMSVAHDGSRLVVHGSGPGSPPEVVSFDPRTAAPAARHRPGDATWSRIRFGETKRFDVELASGETMHGFVHLPLDFDPARKYPAIVFYYGGTNPVTMDFGGRYPKDLWAASGYVVWVPTPSGATGRGIDYSARHVNDWGERTGAEILAGLDAFLAAHPFVDPARLGCIGASYGGFMTLSLLTRTERFAAAVSHAGIASLASYWGEGFWGYQYSAIATAESFPWNSREIYVDKSPLFHADKVKTPLLLTHGEVDTNVPIGESEQIFTALRLLGRDVEFLRFAKQDHHVLDHPVRKLWMASILAWFDWKLKGEPGAWKKLHPK
jgi:dipeptidyl aminopeptidase/acylaminoacyl peptidase